MVGVGARDGSAAASSGVIDGSAAVGVSETGVGVITGGVLVEASGGVSIKVGGGVSIGGSTVAGDGVSYGAGGNVSARVGGEVLAGAGRDADSVLIASNESMCNCITLCNNRSFFSK